MMHRILLAQKRVPKASLSCFSKTDLEASCLHFSWQYPTVVFSNQTFSKRFVTLSQAGTHARSRASSRIRLLNSCHVLKYGNDQSLISIAKFNTLETGKDSTDDDKNSENGGKGLDYNKEFGVWDNRIDLPIMMDASIKQGAPVPRILASDVGCASILGKRTYQEDRYLTEDLRDNILCTAVFDGHGGHECSEYCVQHLKNILLKQLDVQRDLQAVLHHAFLALHSGYTEWTQKHNAGQKAGTTATVCLLRGGVELAVGHVGDSRAILCRLGTPRELTRDHCPSLISEKARIQQSGGKVSTDNIGRHMVNDSLSMSRSIGDLHLKPFGVIALPDTRTLRVKHGKDAFLLLITDGVNFVLRSEEACDIINQSEDPYHASQLLTEQALSMSSEDNSTAVVVPLGSWGKYTKSASMFYSFGIGRDMNKSSRFG